MQPQRLLYPRGTRVIQPNQPLGADRYREPDIDDDERAYNEWIDEYDDEIEAWHWMWTRLRKDYRDRFTDILTSGELEDMWARIDARNKARKAKQSE